MGKKRPNRMRSRQACHKGALAPVHGFGASAPESRPAGHEGRTPDVGCAGCVGSAPLRAPFPVVPFLRPFSMSPLIRSLTAACFGFTTLSAGASWAAGAAAQEALLLEGATVHTLVRGESAGPGLRPGGGGSDRGGGARPARGQDPARDPPGGPERQAPGPGADRRLRQLRPGPRPALDRGGHRPGAGRRGQPPAAPGGARGGAPRACPGALAPDRRRPARRRSALLRLGRRAARPRGGGGSAADPHRGPRSTSCPPTCGSPPRPGAR